jgi:arylesterase / paraoxonase
MTLMFTNILQRRELDPFIGGGNVGYCSQSSCHMVYAGLKLPNGLVLGRDGLIYVPSTMDGTINVFSLSEDHTFVKVNEVKVPLPIDNLSVDKKGDIYAAAIPKIYIWSESAKAPFDVHPPSTVFRIRKSGKENEGEAKSTESKAEYVVEKVIEDDGTVLPGATTAVHDAETGRIILSGVMSPYITICEPILHD